MGNPILRTASWLFTALALLAILTWVFARVLSDRLEWSQFLHWVPTPAILALTGMLLMLASALARAARGLASPDQISSRTPAARTRRVAWATCIAVLLWMLIGEWNSIRYLAPVKTPPDKPHIRVMYWNPVSTDNFTAHALSPQADILVIANPPARADWVAIRAQLGPTTYTAKTDRVTVVSRYPILRWSSTSLNIKGARPRSFIFRGGGYVVQDTGQALFVELDTGDLLARPLVLWALDMPSDFNLSRWTVMRQAAATLDATQGPAYRRDAEGRDQPEELDPPGFPTPDLLVGDLNTPRGSASLKEVAGTMTHAFDQAGRGYAATWPREWAVFPIDQAFVGGDLRATHYRAMDFGDGKHRAVIFDVVRRE